MGEIKIEAKTKLKCGIIMPIAAMDGCSEEHWDDVKNILVETIKDIDEFEANLVSNAADIGIIQKRIIQNIYENPIIVCDVSGRNPNVMFELGMRLAFDKPVIIIKDDITSYSFDASPIEHLTYPRDLRFNKIVEFKNSLKTKILGTYKKSTEDPNYTAFLKNFGQFTVAKLDTTEVPKDEYILEELKSLRSDISGLYSKGMPQSRRITSQDYDTFEKTLDMDEEREQYHLRCDEDLDRIVLEVLSKCPKSMSSVLRLRMIEKQILREKALPCYDSERGICRSKLKNIIAKYEVR